MYPLVLVSDHSPEVFPFKEKKGFVAVGIIHAVQISPGMIVLNNSWKKIHDSLWKGWNHDVSIYIKGKNLRVFKKVNSLGPPVKVGCIDWAGNSRKPLRNEPGVGLPLSVFGEGFVIVTVVPPVQSPFEKVVDVLGPGPYMNKGINVLRRNSLPTR